MTSESPGESRPDLWQRVSQAFDELVDESRAVRAEALRVLGERDARVGAEVASLLAAHDAADGRLIEPITARLTPSMRDALALPEPLPTLTRVGAYRVQRKVGEGGMGAVYEGTRADDMYEQRVAIKTIARGAESSAITTRFRRERQILAQLQHPNIAALLDGGVTDAGTPYFVMEYVDGSPIDVWCARQRCSVAQRLDLMRQVCGAVQHAHRNLVVHRDLKPANVLVTTEGVVKLLDFGIARFVDMTPVGEDGAATTLTRDSAAPMTVAYASPEQLRGEPISTASDVYSLGVILYELLAGAPPIARQGRTAAQLTEALLTTQPPPPSARCTPQAVADTQSGDRSRLVRALAGDVDAIVLKAMHREPSRRYASVDALSDDLLRHLRGKPVLAKPDTWRYRTRKFVQRHRTAVGLSATLTVVALAAAAMVARASLIAQRESERATRIANFLQGVLGAANAATLDGEMPRIGPGATLSTLLDSAARRVPVQFPDEPTIRARLYLTIGTSLTAESRLRDAALLLDSSMVLARLVDGEESEILSRAMLAAATVALHRNQVSTADSIIAHALANVRRARREGGDVYTRALADRVVTTLLLGHAAQAERDASNAFASESIRTAAPTLTKAILLNRLGAIATLRETPVRADSLYRLSIAMLRTLGATHNLEMLDVLQNATSLQRSRGQHATADSILGDGLRWARETFGENSREMAMWLTADGYGRLARGDTASASAAQARAVRIVDSLPEVLSAVRMTVHIGPARVAIARRQWADADEHLRRVIADADASPTFFPVLHALLIHASVLTNLRRIDAADSALARAVAIYETNALPAPFTRATMHTEQARIFAVRGDSSAVERELGFLTPEQAVAVRAYLASEFTRR
ncbi:MAG: serine/threonine protein kinase [Gemmatimonadaceae bacterium]|nr:serine/threonine protein kinase [Gemmatimonadaceae bacterium]